MLCRGTQFKRALGLEFRIGIPNIQRGELQETKSITNLHNFTKHLKENIAVYILYFWICDQYPLT